MIFFIYMFFCSLEAQAATVTFDKNRTFSDEFESELIEGFDGKLGWDYLLENELPKVDKRLKSVVEYFAVAEIDRAVPILEQLSQEDKNNQLVNQLLIVAYIKMKQFKKARENISRFMKQVPTDSEPYNLKAMLELYESNNQDAARLYFLKAIEHNPNNLKGYVGLAKLSLTNNQLEDAEIYCKKILDINDDFVPAYIALAHIYEKKRENQFVDENLIMAQKKTAGKLDEELNIVRMRIQWYAKQTKQKEILKIANKVVSDYPYEKEPLVLLSKVQVKYGKKKQAELTLQKIISQYKNDIDHRLQYINLIAHESSRQKDVVKLFDELDKIKPNDVSILLIKADFFIRHNKLGAALKASRKARQINPELALADFIQGNIYIKKKQIGRAVISFLAAYKIKPNNKLLIRITHLLSGQGREEYAIKLLEHEIEVRTESHISVHYELATLYFNQKEYELAKKQYQIVIKKNPENVFALNNLAYIFDIQGNPNSIVFSQKAYELAPRAVQVLDTHGYILVRQNRIEEGLSLLKKAAKIDQANNEIQFHLAKAYHMNGNNKKAAQLLFRIINTKQNFPEKDDIVKLYEKLK